MASSATPAVTCPACQKKFKGKSDLTGKKVRCPFCKEAFTVPAAEAPEVVDTVAVVPEEAPAVDPRVHRMEDVDLDPYGMKEQDLWPRCPNCADRMESATATICLHCGYNTLTRAWGQTVKKVGSTGGEKFVHLLPGIAVFGVIVLTVFAQLYYSLLVPYAVRDSWLSWLDYEGFRLWTAIVAIGLMWGSVMFCYKRFFIEPLPEEKNLE